jgi:hypothetical protein
MACATRLEPPTPPLLRNVTVGGGWIGACPAESGSDAQFKKDLPLASSPELDRRLLQEFPTGLAEGRLVEELTRHGFAMLPSCQDDPSIHLAVFRQRGGGVSSEFSMTANVYWKVDRENAVAWTRGSVAFTGP